MKKTKIKTLYILQIYIEDAPRKKQYYYFFRGALKFQEKFTFAYALWINCSKLK